jgi:predicted RecA/RadA family phage recombinase
MPVMVDSEGKYVSFTPTVPVAAGAMVALGELVGIAPVAIAAGSVGQVAVRGIVRVPKPVSGGIAAGTKLWWDIRAGTVVLVPSTDEFGLVLTPYLGKAIEGAAKSATTVRARLSQ